MTNIVPAILTDDRTAFENMVRLTEKFAGIIQVDVMDGKLVPSKSISPADVGSVTTAVYAEAHLMVEEPLEWIAAFKSFGARRVLFHYEMRDKDFGRVIGAIRDAGMEPGLVVNPDTSLAEFARFVPLVDMVLFMSVYPGFYGAPFVPKVLDKIKDFRLHFPNTVTSIDGGVKVDNIKEIAATGVHQICVGSAILKADDPEAAWKKLQNIVNT